MSRGLGKMQRDLLAQLDDAKQTHAEGGFEYAGGRGMENCSRRDYQAPPVVRTRGKDFTLGPGVYDLRAAVVWLGIVRNAAYPNPDRAGGWFFVDSAFKGSFRRAVRSLIDRGILQQIPGVPTGREIRFVCRVQSTTALKSEAETEPEEPPFERLY